MRPRDWLPFAGVGGLLGAAFAFSPGAVSMVAVAALIARALYRHGGRSPSDRRFVVWLFLIGFAVRVMLSLALDLGSWYVEKQWPHQTALYSWDVGAVDRTRAYVKMGDSDYIALRGYALAQYAIGVREPDVISRVHQSYGRNGYSYVVGAFYSLFGYSPIAVKFLNCLLGALLGPAVFFLSRACFHAEIARMAGVTAGFFPSVMLWSAANLKEPSIVLLAVVILWLCRRMQQASQRGARLAAAAGIACALAVLCAFRSPAFAVPLAGCAVLAWGRSWQRRIGWWLAGLLIVASGVAFVWGRPMLSRMFVVHSGHVTTPGISYAFLPDALYTSELWEWAQHKYVDWPVIVAIGKAILHYLLEPFPWRMDNVLAVLVYPQMVLWYALLPFALLGIVVAVRSNIQRTFGLVLTLAGWVIIGALTSGNVGTAFRMRDMVTPFFLIFACAQLWTLTHEDHLKRSG